MQTLSKLQIRAKVLSVLSEIKTLSAYSSEVLSGYVQMLSDIEDKQFLLDIVLKEVVKMNEEEVSFCACLIKELLSKEDVEDAVFNLLKSAMFSDEAKYKFVQVLRIVGFSETFNEIPQYFDNPQEMLDLETEKMMERASFNPETMLDFLDFLFAVSDNDKKILLASLKDDFTGDNLANLISPVLYSDFSDAIKKQVVEILADTKSSIALLPFDYLLSVSDNKEIISAVELAKKKLKFSGASEDKAKEFFNNLLKGFKPYECYTTVPDGAGNQALLVSRLNKDDNINFIAIVVNDELGIVDCFGFYNISKTETQRVIAKFYQSEGKYKVSENYIKSQVVKAIQTTINNKSVFPYEFICWNTFLFDVLPLSESIEQIAKDVEINNKVTEDDISLVLTKEYTYRWFISSEDSSLFREAVDKIYNLENIDRQGLNVILNEYVDKIFDAKQEKFWINRLNQLIYLLKENSLVKDANLFAQILKNERLFFVFKQIIVQRSLFNNMLLLRENVKASSLPINIFKKKMVNEEKYDIKRIENIVLQIQKCWLNE